MIVTRLENADRQAPGSEGFTRAFAFLRRPDLAALPDGKYEIDGDRVFALVQRYETAPAAEPRFEAHRAYIDVQYLAAGSEVIGWATLGGMQVDEPYIDEKDACFGRAAAWTPLRLGPGELAVLYPEDAHAPRLAAGGPAPVLKVVIKVSLGAAL